MPLHLQPATLADLPAIATLMNLAFRGTGPDASWNTEAPYIRGDRTSEAHLRADLAAKPQAILLTARDKHTAALQGSVWLEPLSPGTWYLGSLTVDPALQNTGLGRQVLTAAEAWAAAKGADIIHMTVVNVRDTLIAWYERRGYHQTGETKPFPYNDTRFGTPLRDGLAFIVLEKSLVASKLPVSTE